MQFRALSISLCALLIGSAQSQTAPLSPGQLPQSSREMNAADLGSVIGVVKTLDDHPAPNVRVELRNLMTGAGTGMVVVRDDGSFQIYNIPPGLYEIVASSGVNETSERVQVSSMPVALTLHIAVNSSDSLGRDTVSVAQYKVPAKARHEYTKAEDAFAKNNLKDAREHLERALALSPRFGEALTLRAILELNEGDGRSSRNDLQQAIAADPYYGLAYIVQGAALNNAGEFDAAIHSLLRGVSLAPASWVAYFELSKATLAKREFKESLQYASHALELIKDYPPVRLVRAHALAGLQRYQEAVAEFEQFLSLEPAGADAENARAALQQTRALLDASASR